MFVESPFFSFSLLYIVDLLFSNDSIQPWAHYKHGTKQGGPKDAGLPFSAVFTPPQIISTVFLIDH